MSRKFLTITICGALIATIFAAFIFIAPKVMNSDFVKNKIYGYFSTEMGSRVAYEKIGLSFFPRVGLSVYGASLQLPSKVVAHAKAVTVTPHFWPLLLGNIKIADLALDSPKATISIPAKPDQDKPPSKFNYKEYLTHLAPLLASFAEKDLKVIVQNGSMVLNHGGLSRFQVERILLHIKAGGLNSVQANMEAVVPHMELNFRKKNARVEGLYLKGGATLRDGKVELSLKELRLESPRLTAAGSISEDPERKRTSFSFEGKDVDLVSIRKQVLAIGSDISGVADFFSLLKGGVISFVKVHSESDSIKDAFALKNMEIEGQIKQGHLSLHGMGMEIEDLNGDLAISGGIIEGNGVNAVISGNTVNNGRIKLDLLNDGGPFELDAEILADLTHLFPVLEGILGKNRVSKDLARIKKIEGSAEGKIALNGTVRSFKTEVDVSRFNLKAVYPPVPFPILIKTGQLHYDDSKVVVKNLTGTLGESFFSGLHGGLKWKPELHLSILSGTVGIVLDEIYPWIISAAGLKEVPGYIKEVAGRLDLAGLKFEGPVFYPGSWKLQGEGALKAVRVAAPMLPGPLLVSHGKLKIDSSSLLLSNTEMAVLDCRLLSDVAIYDYRKGSPSLQADFTGNLGTEMAAWITKKTDLPEQLRVKAPLKFLKSRIKWEKGGQISVDSDMVTTDMVSTQGVKISLELNKTEEVLNLRQLMISDGVSNGSFKLMTKGDAFDTGFSGTLHKETLDKLLVHNSILTGKIEGDFKASIPLKEPRESNLSGNLHGWALDLSGLNVPLKIEEISLKAEGQTVDLKTMRFLLEERQGNCKGQILFSKKDVTVDLDASLEELDWKNIEKLLENRHADKGLSDKKKNTLPIQGVFRIVLEVFKYQDLVWRPVHAEIRLAEDRVEIQFSEARVCGIEMPGQIKISAGEIWVDFKLLAENQPINPTSRCLTNEEIEGTFSFEGHISGKGKPGELMKGLKGNLKFRAKDGKIDQSSMWTNIFQYLSISNLLTGGFIRFKKDGFQFSQAKADVVFKEGVFQVEKGSIYSDSIDVAFEGKYDLLAGENLNLTLLIAPFTTANWIIRHIPIVNYLMGGTIGTIPVKVTGNMEDPKVTALPLSAVGSGLFGVLERTITAPVVAVEAIDSTEKKEKAPKGFW